MPTRGAAGDLLPINLDVLRRVTGGDAAASHRALQHFWRVNAVDVAALIQAIDTADIGATVREARCMLEVLAARGVQGADLLIAYPLQGPSLQRAGELAATSDRPAVGPGVTLNPLQATVTDAGYTYSSVSVAFERDKRSATLTVRAPETPIENTPEADARCEVGNSSVASARRITRPPCEPNRKPIHAMGTAQPGPL